LAVWAQVNDLNCLKCNKQIQKIRGCDEKGQEVTIEGFTVDRCPLRFIGQDTLEQMNAYYCWKRNILPQGTGWLQQPMKFLNLMMIIEGLIDKFMEKPHA